MKLKIKNKWTEMNQNNKYMDKIEIYTMTWYVSPYWLDTWHNIDV